MSDDRLVVCLCAVRYGYLYGYRVRYCLVRYGSVRYRVRPTDLTSVCYGVYGRLMTTTVRSGWLLVVVWLSSDGRLSSVRVRVWSGLLYLFVCLTYEYGYGTTGAIVVVVVWSVCPTVYGTGGTVRRRVRSGLLFVCLLFVCCLFPGGRKAMMRDGSDPGGADARGGVNLDDIREAQRKDNANAQTAQTARRRRRRTARAIRDHRKLARAGAGRSEDLGLPGVWVSPSIHRAGLDFQ